MVARNFTNQKLGLLTRLSTVWLIKCDENSLVELPGPQNLEYSW